MARSAAFGVVVLAVLHALGSDVFCADTRMRISQVPEGTLPIHMDRAQLVFDPGEAFRFDVTLNLIEPREAVGKSVRAHLRWKLVPAAGGRPLADGASTVTASLNSPRPAVVPLEVPLPGDEGVYNLRLTVAGFGFRDVERMVQLVVLDRARTSPVIVDQPAAKPIDSFEPASAGMFRRVASASSEQKIDAWLRRSQLSRSESAGEPARSAPRSGADWTAYHLHVEHPQRPHRLVVTLPESFPQHLDLYLLQREGATSLAPATLPIEIVVSDGAHSSLDQPNDRKAIPAVRDVIFWPQDREPIVVVRRQLPEHPLTIEKIELFELEERPGASHDPSRENGGATKQVGARRLCGLYFRQPWIAETFGAPRVADPTADRAGDDWQTFLVAGRRLTEQLRFQGANALLLGAAVDGGPLYPSNIFDSGDRFVQGRLLSAGRDPMQKDVLELLYRMFDREGLALVPEMQFVAPLPALESWLVDHPDEAAGVLPVNAEGRSADDRLLRHEDAVPRYNALHPRVQEAVLEAVEELIERYAAHPSFAGVALELEARGYLQLPSLEWGYDDETLSRFAKATRARLPAGDGPEAARRRFEHLTGPARRDWMRWRCEEIARFHRRIADVVAASRTDARLFLTGRSAVVEQAGQIASVSKFVTADVPPAATLSGQGLDFSILSNDPRVVVMRPALHRVDPEPLWHAALATWNTSPALDAAYRAGARGGLMYSLSTANGPSVPGQAGSLVPPRQTSVDAYERRLNFAHALGALDATAIFEGGDALPVFADDPLRILRRAISSLPAVAFSASGPQRLPVTLRSAHAEGATWLYVVNETPVIVSVDLDLSCRATTPARNLGTGAPLTLQSTGSGRSRIAFELPGRDVWCCRLDHRAAEVVDVRTGISQPALDALARRIDRLGDRMDVVVRHAKPRSEGLVNPGFETAETDGELPGWEFPVQNASGWALDRDNPRSGKAALRLTAGADGASLVSPELPLDGARSLTLSLWMRSNRPATRVRLALEARVDGHPRGQQSLVEVGKEWRKYRLQVAPLPTEPLEQPHVRVEPLDRGELWIDDVELSVASLGADELRELTKTVSSIRLAWDEGRLSDCGRLLDGYWGRLLLDEPPAEPPREASKPRLGERMRGIFRR